MPSSSAAYTSLRVTPVAGADGVVDVTLLGPGFGNAMGPDFWRELPEVFAALDTDDQVRAVVVHGSGEHFSVGLDLGAMMGELGLGADPLAGGRVRFLDTITRMQAAISAVEDCRKPVLASVSGWCIGGGVDLIAACDIRVASADAKFSVREARLAIVADVGSLQRLPKVIGEGMTRRLALTAEDITATRAEQIGLVSQIYDTPDAALTGARALAAQIAGLSPLATQGTKQVLNATRDLPVADGLRHVAVWNAAFLHSHDLDEAIAAFQERRDARFEGR
ncbi:MAG TPA: crotonase/enoyl-CoA hydratase family protein [Mycobacteriales bacterium]|nr:crotonase/enoyl-CoA hydratase family protein [Mycobacteriales bacterium]